MGTAASDYFAPLATNVGFRPPSTNSLKPETDHPKSANREVDKKTRKSTKKAQLVK
jgi:hypothetical protein